MLFWLISGGIALAVTAILVGALRASRAREAGLSPAASDIAVYRDQLAEIDRDVARGVLTETEAEGVRVEISRRLLGADKRDQGPVENKAGSFSVGVALTVLIVGLGGLGLYAWLGAPGYSDQPLSDRIALAETRLASRPSQDEAEAVAVSRLPVQPEISEDFASLMTRLRAAIEQRPGDVEGLRLLAQNEARVGNYTAARRAQEQLVDVQGDAAPLQARIDLLDLMVFTAGGVVTPEAEARLVEVEAISPDLGEARYYRGLMAAQNGRADIAFPIWRRLLETSPASAPWVPVIRAEIQAVAAAAGVDYIPPAERGPSQEDIAAAADMSDDERNEMVRGMVASLSDRLANEGGPPTQWAQLIRALGVLGQAERAAEIGAEAEAAFAANPDALRIIRLAVRDAAQSAAGAAE